MFFSVNGSCQYSCTYDFETPYNCLWGDVDSVWVDTISFQNHVWQIGQPQKNVFNNTYSSPNAAVTKLDTFYPINDTSSFVIWQVVNHVVQWPSILGISGYYKINSDSLNDFGIIEFSPNHGQTWTNLMNDSIWWDGNRPVLTGNVTEWNYFSNVLTNSSPYNIQIGDTVGYKFTFISDSIQTNKDGWMLDNIGLNFIGEGIEEINNHIDITVYPNPFTESFEIKLDKQVDNIEFVIYNFLSQQVSMTNQHNAQNIFVNGSGLGKGLYFYQLTSNNRIISTGKILKE